MADPTPTQSEEEVIEIYRRVYSQLQRFEPHEIFSTSLESVKSQGSLFVERSAEKALSFVVTDWAEARQKTDLSSCMILASTQEAAFQINETIQAKRQEQAELGRSFKVGKVRCYQDDRVIFTESNPALGIKENDVGTVQSVNKLFEKVSVKLDSGDEVFFSARRDTVSVQLAYATTLDRVQDRSFDQTLVFLSGPTLWHDMAVILDSPHREAANFYVDRRLVESRELPTIYLKRDSGQPNDFLGYLFDLEKQRVDGNLNLSDTRAEARFAVVDAWHQHQTASNDVFSSVMVAQTQAEVSELNRIAQAMRLGEHGDLSVRVGNEQIFVGDKVVFTEKSDRFQKGEFGIVKIVSPESNVIAVELESGEVRPFSLDTYKDVKLGYAVTEQEITGRKVENAYVLLTDPLTHQYEQSLADMQRAWTTDQSRLCLASEQPQFFLDRETEVQEYQTMIRYTDEDDGRQLEYDQLQFKTERFERGTETQGIREEEQQREQEQEQTQTLSRTR